MASRTVPTILIKNASYVVTMNAKKKVLSDSSILIRGNMIVELDSTKRMADQIIDAEGMVVLPGFINTHHHLFQAFLRHVPALQNQRIDSWIEIVCQLGKKMDLEAHYYAGLSNMIELLQSGCTTTTDMLYFFPLQFDDQEVFEAYVRAAQTLGIRFHPFRGSMSLSRKDGALFDDDVVEDSRTIVQRTEKIIERFHNPNRDAMLKVGIAPCTVFTSTTEDYQNAASLAKKHDLNLQTHLSESEYEQQFIAEQHHQTPLQYLQSLGWDDDRVSFAHCIEVNQKDISLLRQRHNSVCHCPISNARSPIGQKGIAPVWEMLEQGVNVSIGVDGSAGNDSSNMLEEMRWARTLQGARPESTYLQPMQVLEMATMGGARALRWQDAIGSLEVGKCADIAIFNPRNSVSHTGVWDEVGALVSCQALPAEFVIVNGKVVIENQNVKTIVLENILNNISRKAQL